MNLPTVRCPNCQKRQEEPYPERCGCGQSLLQVLASRRVISESDPAVVRQSAGEAWTVSARAAASTAEPDGNEW